VFSELRGSIFTSVSLGRLAQRIASIRIGHIAMCGFETASEMTPDAFLSLTHRSFEPLEPTKPLKQLKPPSHVQRLERSEAEPFG
jgi:hypothetical protein